MLALALKLADLGLQLFAAPFRLFGRLPGAVDLREPAGFRRRMPLLKFGPISPVCGGRGLQLLAQRLSLVFQGFEARAKRNAFGLPLLKTDFESIGALVCSMQLFAGERQAVLKSGGASSRRMLPFRELRLPHIQGGLAFGQRSLAH